MGWPEFRRPMYTMPLSAAQKPDSTKAANVTRFTLMPGNATRTLYMYIYNTAFKYFDMGYASAMAFVLSGLILLFSLINMMISKGEKE